MNITVTARKTSLKDSFKERIQKKLEKLDKYFYEDASASIVVSREGDRETVEVTVTSRGMFFRAERTTQDRFDSLEAVVDALERQILKNKSKLGKRYRAVEFEPGTDTYDDIDSKDYEIARKKKFVLKPMTIEEAILQMNMLGHEFFLFRLEDTGSTCVVYKRKDGSYGLLEPQD